MPVIKLAIVKMQFPLTNSCEQGKYLHVNFRVKLLDFECSGINLKFM